MRDLTLDHVLHVFDSRRYRISLHQLRGNSQRRMSISHLMRNLRKEFTLAPIVPAYRPAGSLLLRDIAGNADQADDVSVGIAIRTFDRKISARDVTDGRDFFDRFRRSGFHDLPI